MTVTLELTDEIERAIERKAQKLGLTASEYIRRLTEKAAQPNKPRKLSHASLERPKTGSEVLDELKAMNLPVGYGDPAIDSPELARQLAAQLSRPKRVLTP